MTEPIGPRARVGWFGTSIMEHYEAYSAQMVRQSALPPVGAMVRVEAWRHRGYVQRLQLALRLAHPGTVFQFENHARGGATSRDVLAIVDRCLDAADVRFAIAFLGCGTNDVWRRFQGRQDEAVDVGEFRSNYRRVLELLGARSDAVVCIGDAPIGWDHQVDVVGVNTGIEVCNGIAAEEASAAGFPFVDVWTPFLATANALAVGPEDLWSDGVHFSELGDALVYGVVTQQVLGNVLEGR